MNTPRFWLLVWGGLGTLVALYVLISATLRPSSAPSENLRRAPLPPSSAGQSVLLTGEMADFTPTQAVRRAPLVAFDHNGKPVSLKAFDGQVVLVNFWATWCAPCLKELPSLDRLQKSLESKPFKIVAVAADPRGPEVAKEFLDRLEIQHLDLYADPRLLLVGAIGGDAVLPLSILYDADGVEIGRLSGEADWDTAEARSLINAVIEERSVQ